MYKLRVRAHFEAAHHLPWHEKCDRVHGHSYHVEFVVGSERLDEHDVVMDLGVLKKLCRELVAWLDHDNLNRYFDNPTVEVVGRRLFEELADRLSHAGHDRVQVMEVTVWETDTGGVTYDGELEEV